MAGRPRSHTAIAVDAADRTIARGSCRAPVPVGASARRSARDRTLGPPRPQRTPLSRDRPPGEHPCGAHARRRLRRREGDRRRALRPATALRRSGRSGAPGRRLPGAGRLTRHQYENEGVPGPEQVVGLLRREVHPARLAEAAVDRFVDALAFNWIVAGTDAHAKNYALLLSGPQGRLAPLYDVASFLPYGEQVPKLKVAMRIGGEYRLGVIEGRHWRRLADGFELDSDAVVERIDRFATVVPDAMATAASAEAVRELGSDLPERLVEAVTQRA